MTIQFNSIEEFFKELDLDYSNQLIDRNILRSTIRITQKQGLPIMTFEIIASYAIWIKPDMRDIIQLDRPIGTFMNKIEGFGEADKVIKCLKEKAEQLKLDFRPGTLTE